MTEPEFESTGDEAPDLMLADILAKPDPGVPDDYDDGRDPAYPPGYDSPALHPPEEVDQ